MKACSPGKHVREKREGFCCEFCAERRPTLLGQIRGGGIVRIPGFSFYREAGVLKLLESATFAAIYKDERCEENSAVLVRVSGAQCDDSSKWCLV